MRAEAGDDTVRSRDASSDDVSCGAGQDSATTDPVDQLADDCETERVAPSPPAPPAPAVALLPTRATVKLSASGTVPLPLRCPRSAAAGCAGVLTIELVEGAHAAARGKDPMDAHGKGRVKERTGGARPPARRKGRVLGRKRYSVSAGRTVTVQVRISRNGRRRLLRRRRLRCRASTALRAGDGTVTTIRRMITIEAPGRKP